MFNDILLITKKETLELAYSAKRLLVLLALLVIPIGFIVSNTPGVLPFETAIYGLPLLLCIGGAGQISYDSILSEKRSKTLDILLSSGISKIALIVGKAVPPVVISYILGIMSVFIIEVGSKSSVYVFDLKTFIILFILPAIVGYFVSCFSLVITILITDEKVSPMIGSTTSIAFFGALYYLFNKLNIQINVVTIVFMFLLALIICIGITYLAVLLLKKISIITKI